MLILLGVFLVLAAFIGGFIVGSGNGVKNALKSKATTYDQTREYLKPVNDFIERALFAEIHRRTHDGRGQSVNGGNSIVRILNSPDNFKQLTTHVVTTVKFSMSKNLKNAFYRIYDDGPDSETLESYTTQFCVLRLRLMVIDVIRVMETPSADGKREEQANQLALSIEMETQKLFGTYVSDSK